MGGPGGAKSRRKQNADAEHEAPWYGSRRKVIGWAVFAVAALLLYVFLQADGGPEDPAAARGQPGRPRILEWTLTATTNGTSEVLCTKADPCAPGVGWAKAQENATCALDVRVWLSSSGFPHMLRDVGVHARATATSGDLTVADDGTHNFTSDRSQGPLEWDGGVWWRAESERLAHTLAVPCDSNFVSVIYEVSGKELFGQAFESAQTTTVVVVPEAYTSTRD